MYFLLIHIILYWLLASNFVFLSNKAALVAKKIYQWLIYQVIINLWFGWNFKWILLIPLKAFFSSFILNVDNGGETLKDQMKSFKLYKWYLIFYIFSKLCSNNEKEYFTQE